MISKIGRKESKDGSNDSNNDATLSTNDCSPVGTQSLTWQKSNVHVKPASNRETFVVHHICGDDIGTAVGI